MIPHMKARGSGRVIHIPGRLTSRDAAHYPAFDVEDGTRRRASPLRRLGRVEDITETCLYPCSDAGGFVTGQVIHANGGAFMLQRITSDQMDPYDRTCRRRAVRA